jgi:hypothetical protein
MVMNILICKYCIFHLWKLLLTQCCKDVGVTNLTFGSTVFLTQLKKQPKITSRKWQSTSHLIHFHGFICYCWEWVQMDTPVPCSRDIAFVTRRLCGLLLLLMPLSHHHQESRLPFQWLTMLNAVFLLLLEQQRLTWSRYDILLESAFV